MAGRGPQTFNKRQKEQQRKERQEMKLAKRAQRKAEGPSPVLIEPADAFDDDHLDRPNGIGSSTDPGAPASGA